MSGRQRMDWLEELGKTPTVAWHKGWGHPLVWSAILGSFGIAVILWNGPSEFSLTMDEGGLFFADFIEHYLPMAKQIPAADRPVIGYFYSPVLALGLVPLGLLGDEWALWVWGALQAASVALLVLASAGMARLTRPFERAALIVMTLWSVPVLHNISWGQISVLVTALVFLAFTSRPVGAALAMALAGALKIYPVVLAPLFAWRRGRVVWAAVFVLGMLLLLLGIPTVAMGWDNTLDFYRWLDWIRERTVPGLVENPKSQYLPHVVARWVGLPGSTQVPVEWVWSARVAAATMVVAGCMAARRFRRDPFLALGVAMPAIGLLVPTSWPHYFAYLPPLLCAIAVHGWRDRSAGAWSWVGPALALVALFVTTLPFQYAIGGWPPYTSAGWLAGANLCCAAAAVLVGIDRVLSRAGTGEIRGTDSARFLITGETNGAINARNINEDALR